MIVVGLLVPTTAIADDDAPPPPVHPATQKAIDVALDKWGDDLCAGRVSVVWRTLGRADRLGWADIEACAAIAAGAPPAPTVWLAPQWAANARDHDWRWYCTIIVHEVGHLAQYAAGQPVGHSSNPRSIMAEDIARPWKGCEGADRTEPPKKSSQARKKPSQSRKPSPPRKRSAAHPPT